MIVAKCAANEEKPRLYCNRKSGSSVLCCDQLIIKLEHISGWKFIHFSVENNE